MDPLLRIMTKSIRMYCLQCRYPLDGLRNHVCPECGQAFDPADEGTYASHVRSWGRLNWNGIVSLACVLAVYLMPMYSRPMPRDVIIHSIIVGLAIACGCFAVARGPRLNRIAGAVGVGLGGLYVWWLVAAVNRI